MSKELSRAIIHNHTIFSDGLTTIPEFFASCEDLDIAVAAITDHDTIEGALKALEYAKTNRIERPQIIAGVEVSYSIRPFSHVIFLFPPDSPAFNIAPYRGFNKTVDDFKQRCPKGLVIFPHPVLQGLQLYQVDAVETNCKLNPKYVRSGETSQVSGADTHFPYPYDKSWNLITLFPGNTAEDLIRAIRVGTTIPITDNNILYSPTFDMRRRQYQKALIERLPKVATDIFHSAFPTRR